MTTSRTSGPTPTCPTDSRRVKIGLVIGIDPGSKVTGYGLVSLNGSGRLTCLRSGQIKPPANRPLAERLAVVFEGLTEVVERDRPEEMAVEDIFFARNVKSALALGHVRGVALLTAARTGIPVFTYSPSTIKKAVVGYGQASKEQVSHMVCAQLGLEPGLALDVTDALACAICHLNTSATLNRISERGLK